MSSGLNRAPEPRGGAATMHRLRRAALLAMQGLMLLELAVLLLGGQWLNALLLVAIMALVFAPLVLVRRLLPDVPAQFQFLVVVFVFAALFLGEFRRFYDRYWWWDLALHASSGLLLGIFGFLLVYVLNRNVRIELHMRPRFVALFAFVFAVAIGALWELFEFAMDQAFGLQMQKPMFNDPSGLTDTMWDLAVDAAGALVVSLYGWWYLQRGERSFIERWFERLARRQEPAP
jgi:hypothetical protein